MTALITVEDVKKARYFYETLLQQKVVLDFGENLTFQGEFSIHLRSHFEGVIGSRVARGRHNNCELYFEHDDLEEVETLLKKEGIEFLHPITEQPWRQKVMRFYDYDGNLIEVGESMSHTAFRLSQEGLEISEISRITYISEKEVKSAIQKYS
ncbi:MAG: VOC family protein [Spirochaetales bacterium]|nr:VOC family protein [Spirochaetales bacterium]